jgi:hypothetical protein
LLLVLGACLLTSRHLKMTGSATALSPAGQQSEHVLPLSQLLHLDTMSATEQPGFDTAAAVAAHALLQAESSNTSPAICCAVDYYAPTCTGLTSPFLQAVLCVVLSSGAMPAAFVSI